MRKNVASHGQKGMALVMTLVILIVVSLGIVAMSYAVADMDRMSVNFGRSDSAYNAAYSGLNAARGYLAGQTSLPGAALTLPTNGVPQQVGSATYLTTIGAPTLLRQDATYSHLKDQYGNDKEFEFIKVTIKRYSISSLGRSGVASKTLNTTATLTHNDYMVIDFADVETEFDPGLYDILAGGNLTLNGNVNGGNSLHTNRNFRAVGNITFGLAGVTGTESHSGNISGTIRTGVAPELVPDVAWDAIKNDTAHTAVVGAQNLNGNTNLSNASYGGKANLYVTGNLSISGNARVSGFTKIFVDGDIDISGNMVATVHMFAKGRITLRGNQTITGLAYSAYASSTSTAVSLKGNGRIVGGVVTKGIVEVSGNCITGNAAARDVDGVFDPIADPEQIITYSSDVAYDDNGAPITEASS